MMIVPAFVCALLLPLSPCTPLNADSVQHDTSGQEIRIVNPGISTGHSVLHFPSTYALDQLVVVPFVPESGESPGAPPPFLSATAPAKLDLLLPLKAQMSAQSGWETLTIVLGAAELAGTGYIMYQHVKKYGLFK